MPRTEARIQTAIYDNGDFRALPLDTQGLYCMLLAQDDLNLCGVIPYRPGRWAKLAHGLTAAKVTRHVQRLARPQSDGPGFVLVDTDAGELLVRTLMRHDGVLGSPLVLKGAARHFELIDSDRLRHVIVQELPEHLRDGWPAWFLRADKRQIADRVSFAPIDQPPTKPLPTPPTQDLAQDPSETPTETSPNPRSPDPPYHRANGGSEDSSSARPEPPAAPSSAPDRLSEPAHLVELVEPNHPAAIAREARAILDRADQIATDRLTGNERQRLRPVIDQALTAGYAPTELAQAIADSPFRTEAGVMGQLRKAKQPGPTSVGNRGLGAVGRFLQEDT